MNLVRKSNKYLMQYIIFILLCVVLGFGTWNPFEASYLDDETSGISINQIVSILCIALLFLLTINVKSKNILIVLIW